MKSSCSANWGQTWRTAVILGTHIHGKVFFKTNHFCVNQHDRIDPLRWNCASCLSQSTKQAGGPPLAHVEHGSGEPWPFVLGRVSCSCPFIKSFQIKSPARQGPKSKPNLLSQHALKWDPRSIQIVSLCFWGSKQWKLNVYVEYRAREGAISGFIGDDLHMLAFLNSCFLLSIFGQTLFWGQLNNYLFPNCIQLPVQGANFHIARWQV